MPISQFYLSQHDTFTIRSTHPLIPLSDKRKGSNLFEEATSRERYVFTIITELQTS